MPFNPKTTFESAYSAQFQDSVGTNAVGSAKKASNGVDTKGLRDPRGAELAAKRRQEDPWNFKSTSTNAVEFPWWGVLPPANKKERQQKHTGIGEFDAWSSYKDAFNNAGGDESAKLNKAEKVKSKEYAN